jgi:hypothetical protein
MEEMKSVRKISIGQDYINAMHFQVGSHANRKRDMIISDIIWKGDWFTIYIKKDDLKQEWKSFRKEVVTHYELSIVE